MRHNLLHSHDGLRLNPNEKHTVVDEADRLEALEIIARQEARIRELETRNSELVKALDSESMIHYGTNWKG